MRIPECYEFYTAYDLYARSRSEISVSLIMVLFRFSVSLCEMILFAVPSTSARLSLVGAALTQLSIALLSVN